MPFLHEQLVKYDKQYMNGFNLRKIFSYLHHFLRMKHFYQLKRSVYILMLHFVFLGQYSVDRREPFDRFAHESNEQIQQNQIYMLMSKKF